jgi:homoserine O-acetyltransferase/O-succinyltransferase
VCAANALSVLIPYFYSREWWDKHIDTPESYTNWRNTWGDFYLDVQDARDLYYRAVAWGQGWVGNTPGFNNDLSAVLGSIKAKTLFIYSPQDQFHLPHHVETQLKAIPNATAIAINSIAGHLICCNADPNATQVMGQAISDFLRDLANNRPSTQKRD